MRILLAFDKFKGTLTGGQVAEVVGGVLGSRLPSAELRSVALADGGDGTLAVALAHGLEPQAIQAADGLGRPSPAIVGVKGHRAFIEMAATCGLAAIPLDERDGMRSTSMGLGLAARALLDLGVDDITIGLGGSASTDGGLGFLIGLGMGVLDGDGRPCSPDVLGLEHASVLDLDDLHPRARSCSWTFLTDVDSPLLGVRGAARMFGPQKGLSPADVERAETALARWADLVSAPAERDLAGTPGAGAAGGIVVGAAVLGQPNVVSGAEYVAELTGLDDHIAWADLVITGEGRFDEQTLRGKGPGLVLERARSAGLAAGVIAGRIDLQPLPPAVLVATSLEAVSGSSELALGEPALWLAEATRRFVDQCESAGLLTGITIE